MSYGAITVTVNVAANATSPQVNTATVSGGGASSATANDSTTIVSQVPVPNVVGDTQAAATTAITGAGLVVGTVTTALSTTVPAGDVISEFDGKTIPDGKALTNLVAQYSPGQRVQFRVWHNGQPEYLMARMGELQTVASR